MRFSKICLDIFTFFDNCKYLFIMPNIYLLYCKDKNVGTVLQYYKNIARRQYHNTHNMSSDKEHILTYISRAFHLNGEG